MSPSLIGPNVLSWASDLDANTIEQAARTAALPFVEHPLALMPDAHFGMGATIGSVIATDGAIIPAAVGVDIGCGMIAVETAITSARLPDDLGLLHGAIRAAVPAGVGKGHGVTGFADVHAEGPAARKRRLSHFPDGLPTAIKTGDTVKAVDQFGTLGSGNHFVEVCVDERDVVWVVLHSGSRGIGNKVAQAHIETAKGLMKRYFIDLPDPDLAYLVDGTDEFDAYIRDMLWGQAYALGNREAMMDAVLAALRDAVEFCTCPFPTSHGCRFEIDRINTHHNFTEREHHHGRNVWLTRKGAVRARVGDRCVIPGSMATGTYIAVGLGNPASYDSCSHGAGRRMSRAAARRNLSVEDLRSRMAGKTWNDRDADALLDEHPDSYKDIESVMADQADLVTVEHTLTQVLNYKGT